MSYYYYIAGAHCNEIFISLAYHLSITGRALQVSTYVPRLPQAGDSVSQGAAADLIQESHFRVLQACRQQALCCCQGKQATEQELDGENNSLRTGTVAVRTKHASKLQLDVRSAVGLTHPLLIPLNKRLAA